MERESFEDDEVAGFLNDYFVAVKVDREERPDVDHIYMNVCQALTGAGGWPLTVIMTPDRKPFFAGTYFPKHGRWGRPGLMDILEKVATAWQEQRDVLVAGGDRIIVAVREQVKPGGAELPAPALLDAAYRQLEQVFDPRYGGFGGAPKFPTPHNLLFLLRYWRRTGTGKALAMVEKTLDAMSRGGIYDHLGGGFARYSTDERWLVPHFEKMAYDNALLCYAYLDAYQCTGNEDFARVAGEIIAYVRRDLTGEEGGFLSAEDADSEGVEGKFYVWTEEEILALLGAADGALFCECYGVTAGGNFEHANILNRIGADWDAVAARRGMAPDRLAAVLAACREKLFAARESRIRPFKDDKVLTAWNGLLIAAFAKAARVLDKPAYAAAAEKALAFILGRMVRGDGRLLARFRDGEAAFPAYLEDYAFLIWGLLELYECAQKPELVAAAAGWADELLRLFADESGGGFFFYGADGEQLIARPKEIYDGAIPSGNSVAAYVLLRLARLTDDERYALAAERTLAAFGGEVSGHPRAYTFFLTALDSYLAPPRHVVIAGEADDPATQAMLRETARRFRPETVVMLATPANKATAAGIIPLLADKEAAGGKATAYICENFACQKPIGSVAEFARALDGGG